MNNLKIIRFSPSINLILLFLLLSLLLGLLQACAPAGSGDRASRISSDISSDVYEGMSSTGRLKEVFVLPVLVRDLSNSGLASQNTAFQGIENDSFTEILLRALDIHTDLNVISDIKDLRGHEHTLKQLISIPRAGLNQKGLFSLAKQITEETGVQSVLFAMIDSSAQRTGGGLGSEKSSEFRYRIWLYGAESQSVIWSSAYKSKQGSLTDNLFSAGGRLDGGLGFRPMPELLEESFKGSARALDQVLKKKKLN